MERRGYVDRRESVDVPETDLSASRNPEGSFSLLSGAIDPSISRQIYDAREKDAAAVAGFVVAVCTQLKKKRRRERCVEIG